MLGIPNGFWTVSWEEGDGEARVLILVVSPADRVTASRSMRLLMGGSIRFLPAECKGLRPVFTCKYSLACWLPFRLDLFSQAECLSFCHIIVLHHFKANLMT